MTYLHNAWYMAAWSHELAAGQVLGRTILDTPVVLFRRDNGTSSALLDRCPHRFAPLSSGRVDGDRVICLYHGLGFDGSGACVLNPHGPVASGMGVLSYPLHEAHRGLWIWFGDPARADPALIPDLGFLDTAPDTAFSCGQMLADGNYEVFVDNLMDLSHTDYLHPTTLGEGAISRVKPLVDVQERHIDVTWSMAGAAPPPLAVRMLGKSIGPTDLVTRVRWYPASVIRLVAATVPEGQPEDKGLTNFNAHILTPATATTTHYFYAATRNFRVEDASLNAMIAAAREHIFSTEDKPMIEGVQRRMGNADFWSLKPLLLPIDTGPVQVRRKLKSLIAAEHAQPVQQERDAARPENFAQESSIPQ